MELDKDPRNVLWSKSILQVTFWGGQECLDPKAQEKVGHSEVPQPKNDNTAEEYIGGWCHNEQDPLWDNSVGKPGIKDTVGESLDCPDADPKMDCWRTVSQRWWTLSKQEGASGEGWQDVSQITGHLSQLDVPVESKQRLISREVSWMAAEKEVGGAENLYHREMLVKNIWEMVVLAGQGCDEKWQDQPN